ncbi:MAG: hypothetical protein ACTHJ8_02195 [Mucilaginibacter sp.]
MIKRDISISADLWINLSGYLVSFRESGGSERKSGTPDFFRSPCGAKAVLRIPMVYFAPRFMLLNRKSVYLAVYRTMQMCE